MSDAAVEYDVLVIDDELSLARNIQAYLEVDGFRADVCLDGESGLALFRSRIHPIVVLDVRLPGMDGFAVLEHLRGISPAVKVIMVTAYASPDTGAAALAAGAYDFLPKPIALSDLARLVTQARGARNKPWPTAH